MAHMDTVPICVGAKPVKKGTVVRSADPNTGLGADDRAGVAVVLTAALEILKQKLPHPPLVFLFAIQEEVGLHGARHVQQACWVSRSWPSTGTAAPPRRSLSPPLADIACRSTSRGWPRTRAARRNRGSAPLPSPRWPSPTLSAKVGTGLIEKDGKRGTSNVGVIRGGEATNVVTDRLEIKAEARSHDKQFRQQIVDVIEKAFQQAVTQVKNVAGRTGQVRFEGRNDYEAFKLPADDPSVAAAEQAVRALGLSPERATSNGGLDANWMTANGIPTVTLGCGQSQIHTTSEFLDIPAFERACQIALRLATGTE